MAFGGSSIMDRNYYKKMLEKNRLIPFYHDGKLKAIITFYITNDDERFIKADPWEVLDDEEDGFICYVAQYIVDKKFKSYKYSFQILRDFKDYLKNNFCNVKKMRWNRWKNNKIYTFCLNIKKNEKEKIYYRT